MARLRKHSIAAAAIIASAVLLPAAPAFAVPTPGAVLTGELGIEGGVYPGGFHPTAGSVEVEWQNPPIALDQRVGKNGHFRISLPPGTYTVVGCGPTASSSPVPQCSKPRKIKLSAGETDHIRLVWALVP